MIDVVDRLAFLAENFDVFRNDKESKELKIKEFEKDGFRPKVINHTDSNHSLSIEGGNKLDLAIVGTKLKAGANLNTRVSISMDVFTKVINADPTENKMYIQWILNIFTRFIRNSVKPSSSDEAWPPTSDYINNTDTIDNLNEAIRLIEEDLPLANEYLTLFEANKRKKKFIELSKNNRALKGIDNPSDINQYKSLGQLYEAVDPFIEKQASSIEKELLRYVEAGQAVIPVRDRKFTVYIPKTRDASTIFANYAGWCTAKAGNGNFASYRDGNKKPNGEQSDIYIVIDNTFLSGESDKIYQIHFETNQMKDRTNSSNIDLNEIVLKKSDALSNYFYDELMTMAKQSNKGIDGNTYLDMMMKIGFKDSLFEFLEPITPVIRFTKRKFNVLPDLSRFTEVEDFVIIGADLTELHPSIGKLTKIELLSLANNSLKTIPKEIGNLKKLFILNLLGNKLESIPDEIGKLDMSNGGSLFKISVHEDDIGKDNYQKLKRLLPNVNFNTSD